MALQISYKIYALCVFILLLRLEEVKGQQNENITKGSYIIAAGTDNPTVNNSLKPYGLVYQLLNDYSVPVKWVINPLKNKDQEDFKHNNISFKTGAFVIPAEFIDKQLLTIIQNWNNQGVEGTFVSSDFEAAVYITLTYAPKWTLDKEKGNLVLPFFANAGIPSTAYGGDSDANWKNPSELSECDDIFALPHADPTWSVHNNLYFWNLDHQGAIWSGCHAVSILENLKSPDGTIQMNFLTKNGLIPYTSHDDGSLPYKYSNPADPVMQFYGTLDAATTNGSEQIYFPNSNGDWLSTTKTSVKNENDKGTVVAYGRAFNDNNRGLVMYEGGHTLSGTAAANIAAQRAFFNFSYYSTIDKQIYFKPQIVAVDKMVANQTYDVSVNLPANLNIADYDLTWSTATGSFSAEKDAETDFIPAASNSNTSYITITLTDNCGRKFFANKSIELQNPPETQDVLFEKIDYQAGATPILPLTGTATTDALAYFTINTLPEEAKGELYLNGKLVVTGQKISLADANKLTFDPSGNLKIDKVTFTYSATSIANLTDASAATYTIIIYNANNKSPIAENDAFTLVSGSTTIYPILDNDYEPDGDLFTFAMLSQPQNGTITFANGDLIYTARDEFEGTDQLTYKICDEAGLCDEAVVNITILRKPKPPVAQNDAYTIYPGKTITGNIGTNDSDPYNLALNYTLIGESNTGFNLNTDGSFTYQDKNNAASTIIVNYQVCNTDLLCADATITINIKAYPTVNLSPTQQTINEGTQATVYATLTDAYDQDLLVDVAISGSAFLGFDYKINTDQYQFLFIAGSTRSEQGILVDALFDKEFDNGENIVFTIHAISDEQVIAGDGSEIIILDVFLNVTGNANPYLSVDPLFSPNGDGLGNENWKINKIETFPDNEVMIFNRWGNEVFNTKNYNNDQNNFKGVANHGILLSNNVNLPEGVYYYIIYSYLDDENGRKTRKMNKGYMIFKR